MANPDLHPFLTLDETDRAHWLVAFFDAPESASPYRVPFPFLRAGESPASWLRDQFRRARSQAGMQDRIRRPVVDLLKTGAARERGRDRSQVLGLLLEVAGPCAFSEVAETLRAWMRSGKHVDAVYRVLGVEVPMRRTVWSILIGWHETEGLVDLLRRDFDRLERDSRRPKDPGRPASGLEQLCFAELGRLAPDEAIRLIPDTLRWPEPYWQEVLHAFLSSLGPREVVTERFRSAWSTCFSRILSNPELRILLAWEQFGFVKFLRNQGICYRRSDSAIRLWLEEEPFFHLNLSLPPSGNRPLDQEIVKDTNEQFAEVSS